MHGNTAHEGHWCSRDYSGETAQDNNPGQQGTVPAGRGEPAVPCACTERLFTYVGLERLVYVALVIDAYPRRMLR